MAFNIGLNVIETDGTAAPAIAGAATSVAAFNIVTERGVPNRPMRVTSFADFSARFGGFIAETPGAYMVKGFFDNGGGVAYVNRVAATGDGAPEPASLVLRTGSGAAARDVLRLTAGYRGQEDPGEWADDLAIEITPTFSSALRGPTPEVNQTGANLDSLAGFSRGDSVFVVDADTTRRVTVTDLRVDDGRMTWSTLDGVGEYDAATTTVQSSDFDVVVRASRADDAPVLETWTRLTMRRLAPNYVVTRLNDPASGSKFLFASDERSAQFGAADQPGTAPLMALGDGDAGDEIQAADYAGTDGATKTGLHAFDPFAVQLVAVDTADAAVINASLAYCEGRGDCMFVGHVPQGSVPGGSAIDFGADLQGSKYGALYGPWVSVLDQRPGAVTPTRLVPPTGHVLGVYARTDRTRGIHKAPAGDGARLLGALDVEHRLSDADHDALVRLGSVNGIRVVPGAGIVVDASRTLSTDTRWMFVNVRLLFNYVKSSLRQGLRWVRQEPNRDQLWDSVKYSTVKPFLIGLYRQGAFGTGTPDEVFTIICDATNNPPDEVDKGNFKVEVYFYPSKPAETIVIVVGQQQSGSSASEG
ncbi:MAG: phage tail sheath family protein [Acidimicrobiia bacterium]|nr:phage tail sheath family protein [Acidimicrobiia bacterium]